MIKAIFTLILFTLLNTAVAQTPCSFFKTGKFKNLEDGKVTSFLERNDSIQTETVDEIEIKLKIQWLDDCSYQLTFVEGNAAFWASRGPEKETPDLVVTITEIKDHTYTQEARFIGEVDPFYTSTVMKTAN